MIPVGPAKSRTQLGGIPGGIADSQKNPKKFLAAHSLLG